MGIFDKNETVLEKYIILLQKRNRLSKNENVSDALEYLKNIKNNQIANALETEELLVAFIELVIDKDKKISESINEGIELYKKIVNFKSDDEKNIFLKLYEKDGIVDRKLFSHTLYSLFEDKNIYFTLMNIIVGNEKLIQNFQDIKDYIINVSPYFTDAYVLKNDIVSFLNSALICGDIKVLISKKLEEAKERIGIYSIDEKVVSDIDGKIKSFRDYCESLLHLIDEAKKTIDKLRLIPEEVRSQILDQKKYIEKEMRNILTNSISELNDKYQEYLQLEKNGLASDAKNVKFELDNLVSKIKRELEMLETNVRTNIEKEYSHVDTYVEEKIGQLSGIDILEKIAQVKKVGSEAITELQLLMSSNPNIERLLQEKDLIEKIASIPSQQSQIVIPNSQIMIPNNDEILPVSQYFDDSISFKKRKKLLEDKRKRLEDKGIVFHKKFDEILSSVLEGDNPYLIGPSGCGKTQIVEMIADLIEVPLVEIGRIDDNSKIIGFVNAHGTYSPTNFFYCYRNGKLAFCDELDNSVPDATVSLNSFMAKQKNGKSYTFPGDTVIKRHPNFRIISAGNTSGNGSNEEFNARGIIDESVQQRSTPIYVGYDSRIEDKILEGYSDWIGFIKKFRKATDKWAHDNSKEIAPGVFTTRDAGYLRDYLDHESKTMEQIIDCQFIQTKDIDYLNQLLNTLKEEYNYSWEMGYKMYEVFEKRVKEIEENNGRRY